MLKVASLSVCEAETSFPHTIFARDFDHTALGGSHIHLELAIFREIVHLTNVLAVVFVVDKDDGPVIARHLRGIFGRKGEFHLAGGRSLDEDNAIEKVVSGFFGLRRRGLRLCTLCERSHQQAGSQNGGQASLTLRAAVRLRIGKEFFFIADGNV